VGEAADSALIGNGSRTQAKFHKPLCGNEGYFVVDFLEFSKIFLS